MKKLLLLVLCLFFSKGVLFAQTVATSSEPPEFIPDRPDQTESSAIVPKGFVQIETGPYLITDDGAKQEWSYNNLMMRVGLLQWLEVRLVGSYEGFRYSQEGGTSTEKGLAPLVLGTKVALFQEQGVFPKTALLYHITLPNTGSRSFQSEDAEHELRANFSHTLSENLDLGYNVGAIWQDIQEAEGLYTVSLAYSLTNKTSVFGEVYGNLIDDDADELAMDSGLTYLLLPNLQLDAYVGRGISESAPDWMFGAGFSWRIPR